MPVATLARREAERNTPRTGRPGVFTVMEAPPDARLAAAEGGSGPSRVGRAGRHGAASSRHAPRRARWAVRGVAASAIAGSAGRAARSGPGAAQLCRRSHVRRAGNRSDPLKPPFLGACAWRPGSPRGDVAGGKREPGSCPPPAPSRGARRRPTSAPSSVRLWRIGGLSHRIEPNGFPWTGLESLRAAGASRRSGRPMRRRSAWRAPHGTRAPRGPPTRTASSRSGI